MSTIPVKRPYKSTPVLFLSLFHTKTNPTRFCGVNLFTWESVDEPAELFLGNVGPAEVQSYWLSPDDAAQHEGCDGLATVEIDVLPKPLVTAPGERRRR